MIRLWSRTRGAGVLVAVAALGLAGCSSDLKFYSVHGAITVDGKPVESTEMHIHPTTEKANRGRTVHVVIVNGKFDTRPVGGVPAGPAEWTIAVAEPGPVRVKNPDKVGPEESDQFLNAKRQVYTKQIEINRAEINVELP